MELDYEALGKRIKERRLQKGLSQEKLAELTDLSVTHISNVEHAKTKVALQSLVPIANALEATMDELLGDSLVQARPFYLGTLERELRDCSELELQCVEEIVKHQKKLLRAYQKNLGKRYGES